MKCRAQKAVSREQKNKTVTGTVDRHRFSISEFVFRALSPPWMGAACPMGKDRGGGASFSITENAGAESRKVCHDSCPMPHDWFKYEQLFAILLEVIG